MSRFVSYDEFVDNVCRDNKLDRSNLTPENIQDINAYYMKVTGKAPITSMSDNDEDVKTGTDAVSVETIQVRKPKGVIEDGLMAKKKKFVEKKRIERNYQQELFLDQEMATVASVTQADHDDAFNTFGQKILDKYKEIYIQETAALKAAVPFITNTFDSYFRLVPGQLITVAAYTGSGKSTTTVNVAARYIKEGKRAFIISNEELDKDMYDMVACILEDVDHRDMVNRVLPSADMSRVAQRVVQLVKDKMLLVIDSEMSGNGTTKAEYVLELIKVWDKANIKPDIVIIDYLTNIYSAGSSSADNHYFQLERFLTQLKNIINMLSFPVVMCAQMHSDDKRKGSSLDTKMIMGAAILRYSTLVLECKRIPETSFSEYIIHKNRRFKSKGKITLEWKRGVMVDADPNLIPAFLDDDATEDQTNEV